MSQTKQDGHNTNNNARVLSPSSKRQGNQSSSSSSAVLNRSAETLPEKNMNLDKSSSSSANAAGNSASANRNDVMPDKFSRDMDDREPHIATIASCNKTCAGCTIRNSLSRMKPCALVPVDNGVQKNYNDLQNTVKSLLTKLNGCCRDGRGQVQLDPVEDALVNVLTQDFQGFTKVKSGENNTTSCQLGGSKKTQRLSCLKTSLGDTPLDVFILHKFQSTHSKKEKKTGSKKDYETPSNLASEPLKWLSLLVITNVNGTLLAQHATVHTNGKRNAKCKLPNHNYRITINAAN